MIKLNPDDFHKRIEPIENEVQSQLEQIEKANDHKEVDNSSI